MIHSSAIEFPDSFIYSFRCSGGEDIAAGLEHATGDADDLFQHLTLAVDDLGHAVAQMAMMVDVSICDIFKGQVLEPFERGLDASLAGLDTLKEFSEI